DRVGAAVIGYGHLGLARGLDVHAIVAGAGELDELELGRGAEEFVADAGARRAEIVLGVGGLVVELGLARIGHDQLHAGRQQIARDVHAGGGLGGREDLGHDLLLGSKCRAADSIVASDPVGPHEENPMTLDLGARGRLDAAFAREERRGLMQAASARSVATVAIVGWLAAMNPERGASYAWVLACASFFLLTGLAQFWLYWRGLAPSWASYVFILVDSLALAAVLLTPNPFATQSLPLPVPLRYASFMYFFVLLI